MPEIQDLAATLREVAKPDMKHKALVAAVRERYSKATKKEIVRAAFYTLTHPAALDADTTRSLA